jgi:hypothetical protein
VAWGVAGVEWQWLYWMQCVDAVILSGRKVVIGGVAVAQWQVAGWQWMGGRWQGGSGANTHTVAWGVAVGGWQWRVWIEGTSAVILRGRSAVIGAVAVAQWQVAGWQWMGGRWQVAVVQIYTQWHGEWQGLSGSGCIG